MKWLLSTLKAWIGAMLAALAVAAQDSAQSGGHLTQTDYIYIAAAFFGVLATVYGVGNSDSNSTARHSSDSSSVSAPGDDGSNIPLPS